MSNVWDEFEKTNSEGGEKKKSFERIDFKEAATQIRLLSSEGIKRMYHFVPQGGKGKGKPVICCGEGCPVCASGNEANPKWLFPALDRNTLIVGVVQLPLTVMRGINRLRKIPVFGPDVRSYDLIIMKEVSPDSSGKPRTTYSVQGMPKEATPKLADDVVARIKADLAAIDMEAVAKPYSPEQTMRYLGWAEPQSQPSTQLPAASRLNAPVSVANPVPSVAAPSKGKVDINKFLNQPEPEADETFSGSVDSAVDYADDPLEI